MEERRERALISACLLGVKCRYDAKHKFSDDARALQEKYELIPVCPEQLGGLPTPRPAAEIRGGDGEDVLNDKAKVIQIETGKDVAGEFIRGAEDTLTLAHFYDAKLAFLKARSPSCGCSLITVGGERVKGDGVTTALLKRNGIEIKSLEG